MEIGFIAIYQTLPSTLLFRNIVDRADGFDFWFYMTPKFDGMGDFRVRILYGENVAELNYVFDPSPELGYPNSTAMTPYGPGGVSNIFLYNYAPNQWHHFQANLRRDWAAPIKLLNGSFAPGLSLDIPFPRLQFDALTFSAPIDGQTRYFAETVWIDDVKLYSSHWLSFVFQDQAQNNVGSRIEWKLFNSSGKSIIYVMGEATLREEVYTLEVYYPASTGQQPEPFRILSQPITQLDRIYTISLPMARNSFTLGAYVAFDGPAQASNIQQNSSAITFTVSGIATVVIINVPWKPAAIQRNGVEILETTWSYYSAYGVVRISTPALGQFSLLFAEPFWLPTISLVDRTGNSVDSIVEFKIFDASGDMIEYNPGEVVPDGMYTLESHYEGYLVYRAPIEPSTVPGLTLSIVLQMVPIPSLPGGYIALNNTQTSITILEQSSQRLTVKIEGDGSILFVAKVSKKPLYVERDGRRLFWSYDSTTNTVSLESETSGTFSLVMENPSTQALTVFLVGAGVVAAIIVGAAAMLLSRRKRLIRTDARPPSHGMKDLQGPASAGFLVSVRSA